jgi:integrase/recombinase XerD
MTTLRHNFIRELVIRGIAARTQESYVAAVYGLAKHYHQPPDQLTDEQLKDYIFYLSEAKGLAPATLNLTVYALRSFYQLVLQRPVEELRQCGGDGEAADGGLPPSQASGVSHDGVWGRAAAQ